MTTEPESHNANPSSQHHTGGTGTGGTASTSHAQGATAGGGPLERVNPQIIDAVNHTTDFVLGNAEREGKAISYQKATQAAAFAVQDATDYMRNIMTISMTAQGIALQKMVENPATAPAYEPILQAAQLAVTHAQTNFNAVGDSAGDLSKQFPSA